MLTNYYPTTQDEVGSKTSLQTSCADTQPYWSNVDINAAHWMTSSDSMHPSMFGMTSEGAGAGAGAQYHHTGTTHWDHAAQGILIPTSAPVDDQSQWAYVDYGSMAAGPAEHDIQTEDAYSRDPSPTDQQQDYFGPVDAIDSFDYPQAAGWGDASDQPMVSPYSEVPPSYMGGDMNSMHHHHPPPQTYQVPQQSQQPQSQGKHHRTSSSSKSQSSSSKKDKSKQQQQQRQQKDQPKPKPPSSSSSKSSASGSKTSSKRKATTAFSSSMPLPQEVHRIASEHISREAWRICKAEAIEMEQRRVQLLQNGSGQLEREMLQQRRDLGRIRDSVLREQGVLEEALRRAERLDSRNS